jgi:uncharacterized membrane protein YhaH (DUF805 family)
VKDLTYLFSSFQGRVSRRVFWRATGALVAAELILTAALARTAGLGWRDFAFGDRRAVWINLVVIAFFFWPSLALCVKRLHDRDLPGWWAALLHALVFIFYADQAALRPLIRDKMTLLISLLPAAMLLLVGAWLVAELVFLTGTRGPNQFGPMPDDDASAAVASPMTTGNAAPHPGE